MKKNEPSGIPDPDVVVPPDDPVVSTDEKTREETETLFGFGKRRRDFPQVNFLERGNNDLESSTSKHEKHQPNDSNIEIEELVKIFGGAALKNIHKPVNRWCVCKVPKDLRNINEQAYTPRLISIGPYHYGKPELNEMENQKLRYMLEFGRREGTEKLKEFKWIIEDTEQTIRNYYQENSSLESPEFVKMILRDAVFIIEFFLKNAIKTGEFEFLLDAPSVRVAITRDLELFENQLPYFLLKKLFEKGAFPNFLKEDDPDHDPFLILSHWFFFNTKVFPKPNNEMQGYEIQHFTDLRRYFLLMDFLPLVREIIEFPLMDLPTVTELHGSGVKFKKGYEGRSSLEIWCKPVPRAMRIPGFKGLEIRIPFTKTLELQIPRLEIDDRSECLYRNMMALELCHYPSKTHICNFILLMNFLIHTKKDVDLLVDQGIIFSLLGNNATVAKMFNNLCLQITPSPSVYHNIGEMLKAHYDSSRRVRNWNRDKATLKKVYFRDIWTGTGTVAGVMLLLLTFIQAVCSILSLS